MRLLAISDLHLGSPANREALADLPSFPDDVIIVAGDVAERFEHLRLAFTEFGRRC
jgi:3',5'-cyclic AMP phosphodiesterase CpdA